VEGLVLFLPVAANITLADLGSLTRHGLIDAREEQRLARSWVDRLKVKTPSINALCLNLSGGNQQKVVLAKWLATQPKVLLLDEPTRGIDINAKQEIYAIINELARSGLGVVMVSSELPEILAIADRILVLAEGRLTAEFARIEATEESILQAALPAARELQAKST
jgi:ribose transport system ATP-binding protein